MGRKLYKDTEKVDHEHHVRAHECEWGEKVLRKGQALGKIPPLPGRENTGTERAA